MHFLVRKYKFSVRIFPAILNLQKIAFPDQSMKIKPLRDWLQAAGIEKHITFYCFRHTCATMLITAGADINTVSRHLTHASILTTQQYFHLVDKKAREAAELIKLA